MPGTNDSDSTQIVVPHGAVVVADAHWGHSPRSASDQELPRFLRTVPSLGRQLVLVGDLFDFWFEYGSVIPTAAFPVLSALDTLRAQGIRLSVLGGNHDRWGGTFWREHLKADYSRDTLEIDVGGWDALVHHGDGLTEQHRSAAVMHRITRHPVTAAAFRWIHPDVGLWLVRRMSRILGESTRDGPVLDRASKAQEDYARTVLGDRPELSLVVLAHTHRSALEKMGDRRWYLNPGSWMEDMRYAVVTPDGPRLCQFRPRSDEL